VHLAAARPEVERDARPTRCPAGPEEPGHVMGARRALETVEHEERRRGGAAGRVEPVEVDEVAVRRPQTLPPERKPVGPEEGTPDRLDVAVSRPPGRREGGGPLGG